MLFQALVTVGSWKYMTVSSKFGHRDWYSDSCLQHASGGLPGSNLDLYQVHTYDTLFFYLPDDPFYVSLSTFFKIVLYALLSLDSKH